MSDTSQGEGWWLAADDRWRHESHPNQTTPPPAGAPPGDDTPATTLRPTRRRPVTGDDDTAPTRSGDADTNDGETSEATAAPASTATTEPTPTPTPAPFEPIVFTGTGPDVLTLDEPFADPLLVTLTHDGSSNFQVLLLDANGERVENLANEIRRWTSTLRVNVGVGHSLTFIAPRATVGCRSHRLRGRPGRLDGAGDPQRGGPGTARPRRPSQRPRTPSAATSGTRYGAPRRGLRPRGTTWKGPGMKRLCVVMVAMLALLVGCGDDDGDGEPNSSEAGSEDADTGSGDGDTTDVPSGDEGSGEAVVEAAPAGQATARVDGQEFTFDTVLASGCRISAESISYGFAAPDGVTTLAAGLNQMDGEWLGSIRVDVPNPDGEGIIGYSPAPAEGATLAEGSVAVDGSSMTYSGPILKQPPNDGSNPPPVDVGNGTISATC